MSSLIQFLSDPNVAYLLLTLGLFGLLAELFHPGALLPGLVGAISFIMGLVGLGQLPFSWGGLALLGLAAGLFAVELNVGVSGLLSAAALVAFVLGSFSLYEAPRSGGLAATVNPWLVGLMALALMAFGFYVLKVVRSSRFAPVTSGVEALRHRQATAETTLNPRGKIRLDGELWTAEMEIGEGGVPAGQPVEVTAVEGVILKVRALPAAQEEWSDPGWS